MGIIPWLIMLRVRNRRLQNRQEQKMQDSPEDVMRRQNAYLQMLQEQSAQQSAMAQRQFMGADPMSAARGIFD